MKKLNFAFVNQLRIEKELLGSFQMNSNIFAINNLSKNVICVYTKRKNDYFTFVGFLQTYDYSKYSFLLNASLKSNCKSILFSFINYDDWCAS